jgi:hypothetical protein
MPGVARDVLGLRTVIDIIPLELILTQVKVKSVLPDARLRSTTCPASTVTVKYTTHYNQYKRIGVGFKAAPLGWGPQGPWNMMPAVS